MRYFVWFSYDGTAYHGWQIQPNGITVQSELQRCLSLLLREEITLVGAGRTDTGVHARRMAAHFDTDKAFDAQELTRKLNGLLHQDIGVYSVEPVSDDLHARFSAVERTYRYYVHTRKDPFLCTYSLELHYQLDYALMNEATWYFEITANRFLRNMVRAVVGTLVEVGRGRMSLDDFRQVIEGRQRTQAGESMPAKALFLENVKY